MRFLVSPAINDQAYVTPPLSERLQNYMEPALLLYIAAYTFVRVLLSAMLFNPSALFSFSELRSKSWAETWKAIGSGDTGVGPLKNVVPLFGSASGVILEVGPADGKQTNNYTNPDIKTIYGIEPCTALHPRLKASAEKAGLGGKYQILDCGAEKESLIPKLTEVGLLKGKAEGVFDTIICCKVLCSVPNQEDTVAGLYELLKPGGRMIICEHVKNPWRTRKGSLIARAIQVFFMFQGWSFLLSGCNLNRNTDEVVKAAAKKDGGWEKVDLETVLPWGTIPFVLGELVKKA